MTEPQQQTTTPAAPPQNTAPLPPSEAHTDVEGSLDQRASALLESLAAESKTKARAEAHVDEEPAEAKPEPAKAEPEKKPEPAAAAKTPEQIATERRERLSAIERMAEEERAKVAAKRSRSAEEPRPPPAVAQEPAPPAFDPKDPASVFRFIESHGVPPQVVADWLSSANDPTKVAEASAKRALTPVEQKIRELEQQQKQLEANLRAREQQAYEARLVAENQRILVSHLESVKSEAPLAARFHAKSPAKFMAAVESVCNGLPEGFTAQDVIDQIEENLSELQLLESDTATSTKRKEPAAAKANVGNRLAAERATTVDEDEEPQDLEERARKLKARLAAAG